MSKAPKKLRKYIPVEEAVTRWRKDPAYVKEYDALEEEFAPVTATVNSRAAGGLTQQKLGRRRCIT